MAEYRLKLDNRSKTARILLEYIMKLAQADKSISIETIEQPNNETKKAFVDARNRKTNKYKSSKDLFNKLGI